MSDFLLNGNAPEFIGLFGVFLYIGAYAALQFGLIRGQGYLYPSINLAASSFVLLSLTQSFNLSSAIIQSAWIAISLVGITRIYIISRRLRFSDEELTFSEKMLNGLDKARTRALLDQGNWQSIESGSVLTVEGEPVEHLIYIASGVANVELQGKLIAQCEPGAMIGEITYMTGAPASATVFAYSPIRSLTFEASKLRKFLQRNADIRAVLEQNIANHLREKLVTTSKAG